MLALFLARAGAQVLYDDSRDASPHAGGWWAGNLLGRQASSDAIGTAVGSPSGSASGYRGYPNYHPTLSFFPELQAGGNAPDFQEAPSIENGADTRK